jgi:hypothetical protein
MLRRSLARAAGAARHIAAQATAGFKSSAFGPAAAAAGRAKVAVQDECAAVAAAAAVMNPAVDGGRDAGPGVLCGGSSEYGRALGRPSRAPQGRPRFRGETSSPCIDDAVSTCSVHCVGRIFLT